MKSYDLAIVGAGPGGYVAAIRAISLGLKTIIIDRDKSPGGTCLNRGCIPTKVLCHISERYRETDEYKNIGIVANDITLDIEAIQNRKNSVVSQLQKNLIQLISKKKIDLIQGEAEVLKDKSINVKGESSDSIKSKYILLATGSRSAVPASWEVDSDILMTSDEILNFKKIPKTLLIIGGGVIGMEFASIFSSFGSLVTVVEALPSILPIEDQEISSGLKRALTKRKIVFYTDTKVSDIKKNRSSLQVSFTKPDGKSFEDNFEATLISIGRTPVLDGIEKLNLETKNNEPYIKVNEFYETSLPGFYAVGDLIGKTGLAHGASAEGIVFAEKIAGLNPKPLNYNHIPSCIYTDPEIARVGLTEKKAREVYGEEIETGTYPLRAIGKSLIANQIEGMVKIIIEKKYKEIIGISLMGANVTEMIAGYTLALNIESTLEDFSDTVFPHPSLSEMVMECAEKMARKGIHS
ncbi:MAG: dihydrolipoyl dehydrogenase [Nitrospinota bacterium]|jgi:dihydrolipoamide dehydrogenase|nr:dihydrolipoyl dehydrogenase [Nitrospinota bacterium]MDP7580790.1 dihydrolipoyl dehydrogenase [Nitrospinota bacterium]HJN03340.1 dihydrolipoyl dehydrogenase [Nitrospinota bacterium]